MHDDKLIDSITSKLFNFALTEEHSAEDHAKEIIRLVRNSKWISVKDRLPAHDDKDMFGRVLVAVKVDTNRTDVMTSVFSEGRFDQVIHGGETHWMPLPEPPK